MLCLMWKTLGNSARFTQCLGLSAVLLSCFSLSADGAVIADFDDLPVGQGSDYIGSDADGRYYGGPDPIGTIEDGPYGPVNVRQFTSGGVSFTNRHDMTFGSWSGFAYSNVNDTTTEGYFNQYAAVTGTGMGSGRDNYGVAFGYDDIEANAYDGDPFDPTDIADLWRLPSLTISEGLDVLGTYITNTTYAALSMMNGDGFAKRFGGDSGNDPDWYRLTAYGIGEDGIPLTQSAEFMLADFRFNDNSLDYIVDGWEWFDLSSLSGARSLHFNVSSSDSGAYGMNSPAYFAMDNLQLQNEIAAVPEPSSLVLGLVATMGLMGRRVVRKRGAHNSMRA